VERVPRARRHGRQLDLDQDLVGRERGAQQPGEEVLGLDPARAAPAARVHARAQRQHHRGQLGRGVGVGHAAAHGAAVADLHVRDAGQGLVEQRRALGHQRALLGRALARGGADAHAAGRARLDERQPGHAVDVDQRGRLGQAEVHGRHQALAAGQDLALVAVLGQEVERLGQAARTVVRERDGFHGRAPLCASMPAWTCRRASVSS
jgi:hypothetical protein